MNYPDRPDDHPSCLIIVCAHAVFYGTDALDETHWGLQPFQRSTGTKQGEHITFIRHVEHGTKLLLQNRGKQSILIFSGGHTNSSFPDISEAKGYYRIANHVLSRSDQIIESESIVLEENATDTLQNILFSILMFYNLKQCYPAKIIVVTHEFKRRRVLLHRDALGWNRLFEVHGIDPDFDVSEKLEVASLEQANAHDHFLSDPYANKHPLSFKRLTRSWDEKKLVDLGEKHPPVVQRLLNWRGGEYFPELTSLPWHIVQQT